MKRTPLKRHKALQPLSREHHHGLLLSWKIRSGFKKGIAPERIKNYADWFYKNYLIPHFKTEEEHIFPVLGIDHKLVERALEDHQELHLLFEQITDLSNVLHRIEQKLDDHIRFEERILFPEIQKTAGDEQMNEIEKIHHAIPFKDNLHDEFWK
ncbi:hemerythrin domain-containing protein [Zhouia spongiae]|uniref:Hemerythrin domain-containing protein n=1 Tax=Zhouia spongiae TaxID=2202721 RepID=A0ABY3YMH1_9FLAO|nr:hemerythrin domain-containing protein [Zhouia spongiae]UNY98799.1 hemerythrin domain-containing protein [Zhouia spongiae]